MDDEDSFLAAIAVTPHDDAIRLIYADWLEERADGRAEYLRLGCELIQSIEACRTFSGDVVRLCRIESSLDEHWVAAAGWKMVVRLESVEHKIPVIKSIMSVLGHRLRDSHELVVNAPVDLVSSVPLGRALTIRATIEKDRWPRHTEQVAQVSIRRMTGNHD